MAERSIPRWFASPRRPLTLVAAVSALTVVGVAIGAPAANAATYTYASHKRVDSNQVITTGARSSLTGGSVEVSVGIGNLLISSYYGYPGFSVVNENIVPAGSTGRISHKKVAGASSKCIWWVSVGGYSYVTCKALS